MDRERWTENEEPRTESPVSGRPGARFFLFRVNRLMGI
jgi:hypothetical protein